MIKIFKGILVMLCLLALHDLRAQQRVTGKVLSPYGETPIEGAYISVDQNDNTSQSDATGSFSVEVNSLEDVLTVWYPGYYESEVPLVGRNEVVITLIPEEKNQYKLAEKEEKAQFGKAERLDKQHFRPGALYVEDVLQGAFPGLNVINKSGMPGEGSYVNLRGIRTMVGDNAPLVVINGVPYLQDMNNSPIIEGYSSSIFNAINVNDIQSIRLLKGAETAQYGSMGSNGVLMIETSSATDLETVIEFSGQYGMATNSKTLPTLGVNGFKSYIGDVGLTRYEDMGDMLDLFPFLRDDPDYYYNFLYNNDTDWQSLVDRSSFVTSNDLRVKGGDAVAKYDLAVGVLNQGSTMNGSDFTRYSTRLNANINLSKRLELVASMALTYSTANLHEQILSGSSNPLMASLYKAPILSPFRKDEYNNQLPTYDVVRQFGVSNPLAVANTTKMESDAFDLFVNTGLNYQATDDITVQGLFGYYSGYNRQAAFIPGRSSQTITPREDGVALNTARAGAGKVSNMFYRANADYTKDLGSNRIEAGIGFQGMITQQEFDAGFGRNTSSDFYKTLSYVDFEGRSFWGYNDAWNWMSFYGYARYDLNRQWLASVYASVDGASSTGQDASRFGVYPGVSLRWQAKNTDWLSNVEKINKLDFHVGYALTGNSRYPSSLSKRYYASQAYRQLAGIVNGNVANTELGVEKNQNVELGMETALFNNRVVANVNLYRTLSQDVIYPQEVSPVYGISQMFVNGAELENKGIEAGIQVSLIDKRDMGWNIGGTINRNHNSVRSIGGMERGQISAMEGDWYMVTEVGQAPYSFYGFETNGVIASQEEAETLNLVDYKGDQFEAGDILFVDMNDDGVIDNQDRTVIGDASPDYFGGFFTQFRYKKLMLSAQFTYSAGNQMYNAVRRNMESLDGFRNQSAAVDRRWQTDGQQTDIPRAMYGDPMGNSRFSDRWIEDASFLRLSNVTLSYQLEKTGFLRLVEGGEVYLTGENLFTFTNYLGLDPVSAFSYQPMMQGVDNGNLPLPTTVKLGLNLQF